MSIIMITIGVHTNLGFLAIMSKICLKFVRMMKKIEFLIIFDWLHINTIY